MLEEQKDVELWHKQAGHPAPRSPEIGTIEHAEFRTEMLIEEGVTEYLEAVRSGSIVDLADSLADTLWIILGTAVGHGVDVQSLFAEISRSNFSKFDADGNPVPHPTIPGKIGKSELYHSPNLGPILARQMAGETP
ncbi:MAG: nucleoside triphosphate pyrophosphohydrolase family protein [Brevibacterium aurantiacum]